jgi:hypothetical protein
MISDAALFGLTEAQRMAEEDENANFMYSCPIKDGAVICLTTAGRFPCSLCGRATCSHFHAAIPYFNEWRWAVAEKADCPWGPSLLQSIGIVPPYIVRPDLVYKQSRWAPFGKGKEVKPGVQMWRTVHGRLYHFWDNGGLSPTVRMPDGHVYVGGDHPAGHTDCLVCRNGCEHVAEALRLAEEGR